MRPIQFLTLLFQGVRTYASQAGNNKGSSKLLLATLAAAGAAGGIYYNQNQASVAPAAVEPVEPAFDGKQFKAFKVT